MQMTTSITKRLCTTFFITLYKYLLLPSSTSLLFSFTFLQSPSLCKKHLSYKEMAAGQPSFNVTEGSPTPAIVGQRSPWHSPVPYLFGGLAAMLGLIAFALLILACSYWKFSGYLENSEVEERDLETGEGGASKNGDSEKQSRIAFEEKILVIMAGQVKPTFLATPMSSRSSSFGYTNSNKSCSCNEKLENNGVEMVKQGNSNQEQQEQGTVTMEEERTRISHGN